LWRDALQNRRLVMYNDFIIIGPKEDLAKIKPLKSAVEALTLCFHHARRDLHITDDRSVFGSLSLPNT
jgi:ABC-type tungstate transport system permease subunit